MIISRVVKFVAFECKLARYQNQFDLPMLRIFTDRQVRRFLIALVFAMAFIWVAMRWFDVDANVVYVFAILAVVLTVVLMLLGFAFSFVLHLYMRRDSGMLGKIEEEEAALKARHEDEHEAEEGEPKDDQPPG